MKKGARIEKVSCCRSYMLSHSGWGETAKIYIIYITQLQSKLFNQTTISALYIHIYMPIFTVLMQESYIAMEC